MKKSSLFVAMVLFFVLFVPQANALTEDQISSILGLLSAFNAEESTIANVSTALRGVTSSGVVSANFAECVNLERNLYLGTRDSNTDGEVTKLQGFLTKTGDFTFGRTTGYFGLVTVRAVKKFQVRNDIVSSGTAATTGYGVVGPKTKAVMACDSNQEVDPTPPTFSIDPFVRITAPNGGESYAAGSGDILTINWNARGLDETADNNAVVTLVRESDSKHFAFPSSGGLHSVTNGSNFVSGPLIRISGYDLGPGDYRAKVTILGADDQTGKDRPTLASDTSDSTFTLIDSVVASPLVVNTSEGNVNSILGNGTRELYRFVVAAKLGEDIGIFKFSFNIVNKGASVNSVKVTEIHTGKIVASNLQPDVNGNVDAIVVANTYGSTFIAIPAGATYSYKVEGVVSGAGDSGDAVVTKLLGDSAPVGNSPNSLSTFTTSEVNGDVNNDFIWSQTPGNGAVWLNGYRVQNMWLGNLSSYSVHNGEAEALSEDKIQAVLSLIKESFGGFKENGILQDNVESVLRGQVGIQTVHSLTPTQVDSVLSLLDSFGASISIIQEMEVVFSFAPPTCTLTANKTTIQQGEGVTLTWTSTNADTVTGIGLFPDEPVNGEINIMLGASKSYTFTFTGSGGSTICTSPFITVLDDTGKEIIGTINGGTFTTVNPVLTGTGTPGLILGISIGNDGGKVYGSGDSITVNQNGNWSHKVTTKLSNGSYVASLIHSGNLGGTVLDSARFTILAEPTCSMTASKSVISSGGSVTIRWSSENAHTGIWSSGDKAGTFGSSTFYNITNIQTFLITFIGDGGSVSCSRVAWILDEPNFNFDLDLNNPY